MLLCIASIACCVAMAMPQVHIVAYCGDLGYGVARGAEMLSLMMAFGIVSRIGSGFLADRIGGIRTLLIGSVAQGFALLFYLFFDSLTSLYVISAMFGLFQGGIVPSYAIIVREAMPAREAATRVGIVIFASVFGMSFGGWVSGVIFDATGSYAAAFLNGLGWNALNITIVIGAAAARGRGSGWRWRERAGLHRLARPSAATQPVIFRLPSGCCSSVYSASQASPLASTMWTRWAILPPATRASPNSKLLWR